MTAEPTYADIRGWRNQMTESLYDDLHTLTKGKRLRCLTCDRVTVPRRHYWHDGWPTCHGDTMLLENLPATVVTKRHNRGAKKER